MNATLCRLLPVLSSTGLLTLTVTEIPLLTIFQRAEIPATTLQPWFKVFSPQGLKSVLVLSSVSLIGAILAYSSVPQSHEARTWYVSGAIGVLGHFAFAPWLVPNIDRIVDGPVADAKTELASWTRLHTMRIFVADLPAATLFLLGFLKTSASGLPA
ncbi:hypothetical protein K432DRAFT_340663 [Lepidopterella palustris CBS 459.81]|uniref:Uncharacterized protein n=1 Tax=Lepidopterella palustris CBS 459.81 TaxID=1314670 RepID=A0A8E2DX11_9PEZI|nr:hypothetical protein K432DRAFT_340663 [Lepidopterella palustris CBS 459.81]